jgi:hypothetical protein
LLRLTAFVHLAAPCQYRGAFRQKFSPTFSKLSRRPTNRIRAFRLLGASSRAAEAVWFAQLLFNRKPVSQLIGFRGMLTGSTQQPIGAPSRRSALPFNFHWRIDP